MLSDIHIHGIYNKNYFKKLKNYFRKLDYGIILASVFPSKYRKTSFTNEHLLLYLKGIKNAYGFLTYDLNKFKIFGKEVENDKILGFKFYTGYYDFKEDILDNYLYQIDRINLNRIKNVMFHGGYCNIKGESRYFNPFLLINLIKKYPNINFIVAHFAQPFYGEMMDLLRYKNVYTDISALLTNKYLKNHLTIYDIKNLFKVFNYMKTSRSVFKKVLFGTDFPLSDINLYLKYGKIFNLSSDDIYSFSKNNNILFRGL